MTVFTKVRTGNGAGFDKGSALFGAATAIACIHEGVRFEELAFEGTIDCRVRSVAAVEDPVSRARIALAGPAVDLLVATIEVVDLAEDANTICGEMLVSWQEDAADSHSLYHRDLLAAAGLVTEVVGWVIAFVIANAVLLDQLAADVCTFSGKVDYKPIFSYCLGNIAEPDE